MATTLVRTNGAELQKYDAAWQDKLDLIKNTVAKGCSENELDLFLYTAKKRGLDPLTKQIYAIRRETKSGPQMTIQTGIDGFRVVAARTNQLAGIEDAIFDGEQDKTPKKATVTVYRLISGVRCPFTATARWDEYKQTKYNGELMGLWAKMPYTMLAKCAEALALRKAFPEDLSGIYTFDEMAQADNGVTEAAEVTVKKVQRKSEAAVIEVKTESLPPVDQTTITPEDMAAVDQLFTENATPSRQDAPQAPAATQRKGCITEKQRKRLWAIAKEKGIDTEQLRQIVASHGFEHSDEITLFAYDAIVKEIQG